MAGCGTRANPIEPMTDAERQQLLEWIPLVEVVARRKSRRLRNSPLAQKDDLTSAGTLGLLYSIRKFDPSRGFRFKTYAEFNIDGAMRDYLREIDVVSKRNQYAPDRMHQMRWHDRYMGSYRDPELLDSFEDLTVGLNDREKTFLYLHFICQISMEHIARSIHRSGPAVSKAISRALEKIRARLGISGQ